MNNKAQLEQIFTYIFILVVTALIIFLGYKGISYIKDTGCDVELANFLTDIKGEAEKNYDFSPTSITIADLRAPCDLNILCFFNPEENINFNKITDKNLIKKLELLVKNKDENLYVSVDNELKAFKVDNLKAKDNIQCIENPSGIKLVFENKGSYSEVTIE